MNNDVINDIEYTAKQELITSMLDVMVTPNIKDMQYNEKDNEAYASFMKKVKTCKHAKVTLPLAFVLKYDLFELIKQGKLFIESLVKFNATITTDKPGVMDNYEYKAKYIGNELNYSFLDNHPGIINIDKLKDIPIDYEGLMAVPPTVLEYKNVQNFIIHRVIKSPKHHGKYLYSRVIVSNKFAVNY